MITVMLEHVICLHTPFLLIFSQEFHEKLLWYLGESERKLLGRYTEWRSAWWIVADTATIVVLLTINNNSGMPNTLKVLSDELHGHLLGNALRQIIIMKLYFPHFLFYSGYFLKS